MLQKGSYFAEQLTIWNRLIASLDTDITSSSFFVCVVIQIYVRIIVGINIHDFDPLKNNSALQLQ